MTTLTDRRVWSTNPDRWVADAVSGQDYDPFGMVRPNRSVSEDGYRFGFNGKEKDTEFSNESYDFGARIYDGRVARWLSVDPLGGKIASESVYSAFLNCPVFFTDPDGKFVISAAMKAKYPNLAPTLEVIKAKLNADPDLMKSLMKWGTFPSKESVLEMFEDGKGPTLKDGNLVIFNQKTIKTETLIKGGFKFEGGERVEVPDRILTGGGSTKWEPSHGADMPSSGKEGDPAWAITEGSTITLTNALFLSIEEMAKGDKSAINKADFGKAMELFEATILHETVHYGNNVHYKGDTPLDKSVERGNAFENESYYEDVDVANSSPSIKSFYIKASGGTNTTETVKETISHKDYKETK